MTAAHMEAAKALGINCKEDDKDCWRQVRDISTAQSLVLCDAARVEGNVQVDITIERIGPASNDDGQVAGGRFSHVGERLEEIAAPDVAVVDVISQNLDAGVPDDGGIRGAPRTRLVWDNNAPVDGIKEGKVSLGFLGACAFGPVLVGATLEITTGSEGTRTGNFDPPPFNAVDPESVDAGLIADAFELSADAGVVVSDVNAQ